MFRHSAHTLFQHRVRFFNTPPVLGAASRSCNTPKSLFNLAVPLGLMVGGTVSFCEPRLPLSAQESGAVAALLLAAETGDLDKVNALIEKGALVNSTTKDKKFTALMFAANEGHINVVKYLITRGAHINAQGSLDFGGYTSLIYAASLGHIEVVKFMLLKGADVNLQSSLGNTPLISAAYGDHLEIVKCLVEQGANVNARSAFGTTALINAACNNNFKLIKYLHAQGADLNAVDDNKRSPLALAIRQGNLEIVSYLIKHGAVDKDAVNLAHKYGDQKIIKCVINNDEKINTKEAPMLLGRIDRSF